MENVSTGMVVSPLSGQIIGPLVGVGKDRRNLRLCVIGHGRHGKDTVCDIMTNYGYRFISSSDFVGREVIYDKIGHEYQSYQHMYEDRGNRRAEWFNHIREYNTPDATRTACDMFDRGFDIYCGMRRRGEMDACKAAGVFDAVIWVDRSDHLPPESADSMELTMADANLVVDNNGTLRDLGREVGHLMDLLARQYPSD